MSSPLSTQFLTAQELYDRYCQSVTVKDAFERPEIHKAGKYLQEKASFGGTDPLIIEDPEIRQYVAWILNYDAPESPADLFARGILESIDFTN